MYTLMRYLEPDVLADMEMTHFDEWASVFGEVTVGQELKPESVGKYQLKTRFSNFNNLPELMTIFKEVADIRTADTLNLDKPKAIVKEVVAKPSRQQKRAIKELGKRAAKIRSGNVDPREDNMLSVTNDGRKIGLDQRLFNKNLPDDPNSKVNLCVNNVFDIYKETADNRSTQMIFCDMSTPKSDTRQEQFLVYRPAYISGHDDTGTGFECVRKKVGFGNVKKNADKEVGFAEVKAHIDKQTKGTIDESDKLRDGDIVIIRRPTEDMKNIVSEAAVFENGKFITADSEENLNKLGMSGFEEMPPKEFNIYDDIKNNPDSAKLKTIQRP